MDQDPALSVRSLVGCLELSGVCGLIRLNQVQASGDFQNRLVTNPDLGAVPLGACADPASRENQGEGG
jgi:hypothetical protein